MGNLQEARKRQVEEETGRDRWRRTIMPQCRRAEGGAGQRSVEEVGVGGILPTPPEEKRGDKM